MADDLANASLEAAADLLEASGRYRVLRRLDAPQVLSTVPDAAKIGVVLDVETTGLDVERDEIIELAMLKFAFFGPGEMIGLIGAFSEFNEPANGIPEEITDLTGITIDDVAGHRLDLARAEQFLADADVVIAHNAYFDRPVSERYLPSIALKPWACSATEIPWRSEGITGAKLEYLLASCGVFYEPHRALDDCTALLELLSRRLPRSEKPALEVLLEAARQTRFRIYAVGASYESRSLLKKRGYKWSGGENSAPKAWWIDTSKEELDQELAFLGGELGLGNLPIYKLTAKNRFRSSVV